jgi:hypothetical protein
MPGYSPRITRAPARSGDANRSPGLRDGTDSARGGGVQSLALEIDLVAHLRGHAVDLGRLRAATSYFSLPPA